MVLLSPIISTCCKKHPLVKGLGPSLYHLCCDQQLIVTVASNLSRQLACHSAGSSPGKEKGDKLQQRRVDVPSRGHPRRLWRAGAGSSFCCCPHVLPRGSCCPGLSLLCSSCRFKPLSVGTNSNNQAAEWCRNPLHSPACHLSNHLSSDLKKVESQDSLRFGISRRSCSNTKYGSQLQIWCKFSPACCLG